MTDPHIVPRLLSSSVLAVALLAGLDSPADGTGEVADVTVKFQNAPLEDGVRLFVELSGKTTLVPIGAAGVVSLTMGPSTRSEVVRALSAAFQSNRLVIVEIDDSCWKLVHSGETNLMRHIESALELRIEGNRIRVGEDSFELSELGERLSDSITPETEVRIYDPSYGRVPYNPTNLSCTTILPELYKTKARWIYRAFEGKRTGQP